MHTNLVIWSQINILFQKNRDSNFKHLGIDAAALKVLKIEKKKKFYYVDISIILKDQ